MQVIRLNESFIKDSHHEAFHWNVKMALEFADFPNKGNAQGVNKAHPCEICIG